MTLRLLVAVEKTTRFGFGMADSLDIYVVYKDPSDYPDKFVVRRQSVVNGDLLIAEKPEIVCDTLEEARKAIPRFLFRLDRHPGDVLSIVESWL